MSTSEVVTLVTAAVAAAGVFLRAGRLLDQIETLRAAQAEMRLKLESIGEQLVALTARCPQCEDVK